MWFPSWLRNRKHNGPGPHGRRHKTSRKQAACRLTLEALEDRWLPSTLYVNSAADDGSAGTLRYEIGVAKSGDLIDLSNISGQTISLTSTRLPAGELVINKNLTIEVPNASLAPVTISGGASRVFEVDGAKTTVTLSNLNLNYGNGVANYASAGATDGQGGAIWNAGTLTIGDCTISGNSASTAGLLGPAALGGAIYNAGTLTISNSDLNNNSVGSWSFYDTNAGDGGAIYNAGTLMVNNCILDANTAIGGYGGVNGANGGAIYNASKATATITASSLFDNAAWNLGGGIFNAKGGHLKIASASSVVGNSFYDLYNLGSVNISSDSDVGVTNK